jgi:hypothetical protein
LKSKTNPSSKSTSAIEFDIGAIGHQSPVPLSPQDETLFKTFQSNLLSLISHELKTPLMGIQNALSMLTEIKTENDSQPELIKMAQQNARRLLNTLTSLLDLAAIESGTFHAKLREVDLYRLVHASIKAQDLKTQDIKVDVRQKNTAATLGDPQKINRALDLCLQGILMRIEPGTHINIGIDGTQMLYTFQLVSDAESTWDTIWSQALAGFEGGVASPGSAFAGVLQSEQAFLTRMEEGLGSEWTLIHEIMKLHESRITGVRKGREVTLFFQFKPLSSEDAVRSVLLARSFEVTTAVGSLGFVMIQGQPGTTLESFRDQIKACLFRASDAVYLLPKTHQLAMVLDDCKQESIPLLLKRIEKALGIQLHYGFAHCPTDGLDPGQLMEFARQRLASYGI